MDRLLRDTAAYRIISGDRKQGRASHAYMLHYEDQDNLREALKIFACALYGGDAVADGRIMRETHPDVRIYPAPDGKISVDDAGDIVSECALRPSEGDIKIFAVTSFETAAALVQNKLLKVLEEPPEGVMFLLGAASLSPVLPTVMSRVKLLEIPPFPAGKIYECLEREGHSDANRAAAEACGGILGVAQGMVRGDRYGKIRDTAAAVLAARPGDIAETVASVPQDYKYRSELLREIQYQAFGAFMKDTGGAEAPLYLWVSEQVPKALADVRFNAQFPVLLYDFMLRLCAERDKWQKLSE